MPGALFDEPDVDGARIAVRFSTKADGDFRPVPAPGGNGTISGDLHERRRALCPGEWTWLRQVHGDGVVVVTTPGEHAGVEADAAVTAVPGATLAIHTADCVPVLFSDPTAGVVGAAHAGWRGLAARILERTLDAMGDLGATHISAVMGPHIRARCYEFGAAELDAVARIYGDDVRAATVSGSPALDLSEAVRVAMGWAGVPVGDAGGCTACEPARYFSHRARRDDARHASTVTIAAAPTGPQPGRAER